MFNWLRKKWRILVGLDTHPVPGYLFRYRSPFGVTAEELRKKNVYLKEHYSDTWEK